MKIRSKLLLSFQNLQVRSIYEVKCKHACIARHELIHTYIGYMYASKCIHACRPIATVEGMRRTASAQDRKISYTLWFLFLKTRIYAKDERISCKKTGATLKFDQSRRD